MLKSGEMRSSALTRAQAQLAGHRVSMKAPKESTDEHKDYINGSNKTGALKPRQMSFADLSDLSSDEWETKHKATENSNQVTYTQSRFLKKKPQSNLNSLSPKNRNPIAKENKQPVHLKPAVKSNIQTSPALKRLAEIENRHRLRKLELDISESDSDLRSSSERFLSVRSSSDLSARGNRFLKKKDVNSFEPTILKVENAHFSKQKENKRIIHDSEEEKISQLVESSLEMSEGNEKWLKMPKPPRTPSPPSKRSPRVKLHRSPSALGFNSPRRPPSQFSSRTPSPPSRGTPRFSPRKRSFSRLRSRSPSPSVRSSLTDPSSLWTQQGRRNHTPRSQRSDVKSLEELFYRTEDISSASSGDFKLNILSLDELAPSVDTEEVKEKDVEVTHIMDAQLIKTAKDKGASNNKKELSTWQKSYSDEESASEIRTASYEGSESSPQMHTENSEFSKRYSKERNGETTINSDYSEDFEDSLYTSSEVEETNSNSSRKPTPLEHTVKRAEKVQSITTRETSVQTNEAEFPDQWPHMPNSFIQFAAHSFVDPVSIASHVVSPEVIEALTTYNPMALALNDLFKQQLYLIRSFVDMTRQLHHTTVANLEREVYHYTTLDETKEVNHLQCVIFL
ncbi:uncharacterized protein C19orf44 homolog [Bombina bombina]|uniref:uncharacterized protein C19orf44 homolog n=1 Tax=Bombina bombina TaxID=8345 RepID=UPI00235A8F06|nr:uncharacterized protein C19orf44 homolog [Bombina bombina]